MDEAAEDAARPLELDQSRMGRLSRIDALQGQQMAQEIERRRQRRLVAIDGALQRIESGEFGSCFVCGREIGAGRLAAAPATTRRLDYASASALPGREARACTFRPSGSGPQSASTGCGRDGRLQRLTRGDSPRPLPRPFLLRGCAARAETSR